VKASGNQPTIKLHADGDITCNTHSETVFYQFFWSSLYYSGTKNAIFLDPECFKMIVSIHPRYFPIRPGISSIVPFLQAKIVDTPKVNVLITYNRGQLCILGIMRQGLRDFPQTTKRQNQSHEAINDI
jgi:hypothetical protein